MLRTLHSRTKKCSNKHQHLKKIIKKEEYAILQNFVAYFDSNIFDSKWEFY